MYTNIKVPSSLDLEWVHFTNRVPKDKLYLLIQEISRKRKGKLTNGYIYVYSDKRFTNLYKIGRTKGDAHTRLKQWKTKCKSELVLLAKFQTPRVQLAECLIHLELKCNGKWKKIVCSSCQGYHIEFFKGNLHEFLDAIKYWVSFLEQKVDSTLFP